MSSKSNKRRQRRINTNDEESEKKIEAVVEDDTKSNISSDTDKPESSLKDETENDKDIKSSTPKDSEPTIENGKDEMTPPENSGTSDSPKSPQKTNAEKTNGERTNGESQNKSDNKSDKFEFIDTQDGSDMDPLIMDSEEPELQFPSETGSDQTSELDKSPVLNRCITRRSQTRNLPTPKTPNRDFNGDVSEKPSEKAPEKSPVCLNEVRVNITRLSELPESEPPLIELLAAAEDLEEKSENVSVVSNEMSTTESSVISEKVQEADLTNASIFVNYTGNDTTRNLDITLNLDEPSTFLESTKDLTYGETLRCLSGRRGLRPHLAETYRPRLYKSSVDLTSRDLDKSRDREIIRDAKRDLNRGAERDLLDGVKKFASVSGVKRKLDQDCPEDDEFKRIKVEEENAGIFSYISSPFKNKGSKSDIPSSTPKLTSFKYMHQGSTVVDEVSQITMDYDEKPNLEPKKWCSIM